MKPPQNFGFSLIETLVAIGIIGIAIAVWVTTVGQGIRFNQVQRNLSEEDELSQYISNTISCPLTLDPPGPGQTPCTALKQPLKLFDHSGKVFIDTPSTTLKNKYKVRARCDYLGGPVTPQPKGIVVESLRLNTVTGAAAADPQNPSITENWKPVFEPGLSPCPLNIQPEYLTVTNHLKIDPVALVSILLWATNGSSPVNLCADSYPNYWEVESSIIYEGAAVCPRGYSAVNGGVDCSMKLGGVLATDIAPFTSPNGIRRKAWKTNSTISKKQDIPISMQLDAQVQAAGDDTDLWFGGCCVAVNIVSSIPILPFGNDIRDRVWVRCKRDLPI